jgi:hypothetical protein
VQLRQALAHLAPRRPVVEAGGEYA